MATGHWLNKTRLAPLYALMFGVGAATLVAAMLPGTFAAFVGATGLAGASKPLAMLAAFVAVALPVWIATTAVERALENGSTARKPAKPAADAGDLLDLQPFAEPDAPPARRPIFADRELGAPLMSDEALRTVVPLPVPEVEQTAEDVVPIDGAPIAPLSPPEANDVEPVASPVAALPVDDVVMAPLSPPEGWDTAARAAAGTSMDAAVTGEILAAPLAVQEFDLGTPDEADDIRPGESSIDALMRRLESGLARRGPPTVDTASPQFAAVLRSEIARAPAPPASARTGKPDDATARALHILRQMPNG